MTPNILGILEAPCFLNDIFWVRHVVVHSVQEILDFYLFGRLHNDDDITVIDVSVLDIFPMQLVDALTNFVEKSINRLSTRSHIRILAKPRPLDLLSHDVKPLSL